MVFPINCTCAGIEDDVQVEALHVDQTTNDKQLRVYSGPNPIDIAQSGSILEAVTVRAVKPGFWRAHRKFPQPNETIDCPRIDGPRDLGWWHHAHGITTSDQARGKGIRIGVIDESLLDDDPSLSHVSRLGRMQINGLLAKQHPPAPHTSHGRMVCSLLAAKPTPGTGFEGIAPGAEILFVSARSDTNPGRLNQQYVSMAIDLLAFGHQCHIIVVCAGDSPTRNDDLRERILDARSRVGTVCFFAAGNGDGKQAGYPARDRYVVGVTALSRANFAPNGTLAHDFELNAKPTAEGYFACPFNSVGVANGCIAAGAALFETRNHQVWSDVSGTSCAAPIAAGVLAVCLSGDRAYHNLPPGVGKAKHALNQFNRLCQPMGFHSEIQGLGRPILNNI